MNRLSSVIYLAVALAAMAATTVQSEPYEAMAAVDLQFTEGTAAAPGVELMSEPAAAR